MKQGYTLPLQTRFDPLKETARTSSTQPGPPLVGEQMQNFPRETADGLGLRETFTPRPGMIFIGADYSMAELHTLAQLCLKLFGYSRMADLLNAGVDLHWHFAAETLGKPYEEVKGNPLYDQDRQRAKPANFGYPGGMGPDKFMLYSRASFGVRFTREEAVRLKAQWLSTFPEMREYLRWVGARLGDASSFTHVHPITGFVRGGCRYTSGANHGFQHLTAYGAKDAVWDVTKACFDPSSPLCGWRIWNFGHDEILMEGPLTTAAEAATELSRVMEQAFNAWVPDVPTKAEPWISAVWSKKVKGVRDENGRLIPWQAK